MVLQFRIIINLIIIVILNYIRCCSKNISEIEDNAGMNWNNFNLTEQNFPKNQYYRKYNNLFILLEMTYTNYNVHSYKKLINYSFLSSLYYALNIFTFFLIISFLYVIQFLYNHFHPIWNWHENIILHYPWNFNLKRWLRIVSCYEVIPLYRSVYGRVKLIRVFLEFGYESNFPLCSNFRDVKHVSSSI